MSLNPNTAGRSNLAEGEAPTRGVLPLPEVEMDAVLGADYPARLMSARGQDAVWPPPWFIPRDKRLALYRELWLGDLRQLVGPYDRVPRRFPNLFRRIPEVIAALLLTSPPNIDDDEARLAAVRAIRQAILHMMRSGMTWIGATGGELYAHEPAWTYPISDGSVLVTRPYPLADRIRFRHVGADGSVTTWLQEFNGSSVSTVAAGGPVSGTVGPIIEPAMPLEALDTELVSTPNVVPLRGNWGQSNYDSLAGLICELAESHDRSSSIRAAHERPLLTYRIANADVTNSVLAELDTSYITESDDSVTAVDQFVRGVLRKLRSADALRLLDGVSDLSYVTWDGQLAANQTAMESIHEELRLMTGLPSLLTSATGQLPSGESLKRQLLILYATTSELHRTLLYALERALGQPLDWPHAFEALETDTREPEPAPPSDEPEEGTE